VKLKGFCLHQNESLVLSGKVLSRVGGIYIRLAWLAGLHVGLTATLDFIVGMKSPFLTRANPNRKTPVSHPVFQNGNPTLYEGKYIGAMGI